MVMAKNNKTRKGFFKDDVLRTIRFERAQVDLLEEIADTQTIYTGKIVNFSQLVREAVEYYYDENQRFRDIFRRSRQIASWRRRP